LHIYVHKYSKKWEVLILGTLVAFIKLKYFVGPEDSNIQAPRTTYFLPNGRRPTCNDNHGN
jgi:hypothetical protein